MLYSKTKTDKNSGLEQVSLYLTQGDTATIIVTPERSDGEEFDMSIISKCLFKLSDSNYSQIFAKEFSIYDNTLQVRLESEETASIEVGEYIYEVEYTFIDGSVYTPNQTDFEILDQIVE